MPASRKQESGKHRFARALSCALPCPGGTRFGCFSAEMLATEANSTVEFGLLWLLAYSGRARPDS